jgi:hypothetical protein
VNVNTATKAVTVLLPPPTDAEEDFAFCEGLLREWLNGTIIPTPPQIIEALETLAKGVTHYRGKVVEGLENFSELQGRYNALLVQSAQHVAFMAQQRELLDQTLVDQQREFHTDTPKDSLDGFTR